VQRSSPAAFLTIAEVGLNTEGLLRNPNVQASHLKIAREEINKAPSSCVATFSPAPSDMPVLGYITALGEAYAQDVALIGERGLSGLVGAWHSK